MNVEDFVYRETYASLIRCGFAMMDADQIASNCRVKYNQNRFTGSVVDLINDEVKAAKKLYGAKK